jgi:hypothetical protein
MSEQQEKAVGIIDVAGLPVITGDCKPGDRLYTAPPSVEALTKANAVLDALCEDRINEIASLRTTNAAQAERIAELEAAYDQAGRTIQTQGRELSISESRLHDVAVHCANVELELSILQSSSPAEPRKYFYYSPDVGFNIVDSLEEAKKFANNEISEYRDQADQEWPAEVDEICIGYLIAETVEVETVPGGCDYVLEAIASTAKPEPLSAAQGVPEGLPIEQEPKYTTDGKSIINRASGEAIPHDEPVFIFRARDKFALNALNHYRDLFEPLRRDTRQHRMAVNERCDDFYEFAINNPNRMKSPDTAAPEQAEPLSANGTPPEGYVRLSDVLTFIDLIATDKKGLRHVYVPSQRGSMVRVPDFAAAGEVK